MCEWTRNLTVLSVPEESWSFEVLYIIFHVRFINSFQTRTTRSFLILISSRSSSSFLLSFLFSTLLHNVCLVSFNFVQGTFETNRKKKLVTDFIEPNTAIKKNCMLFGGREFAKGSKIWLLEKLSISMYVERPSTSMAGQPWTRNIRQRRHRQQKI